MKLEINQTNWVKRRRPTAVPQPVSVTIPDLVLERDASCEVFVLYSDEVERKLKGRVIFNEIKKTWSVSAIANGGWMVSIAVEED